MPGSDGIGDSYFPLDGNGGIDVVRYRIHDRYRFETGRLSGRTVLTIDATQDLVVVQPRPPAAGPLGRGRRHRAPPTTGPTGTS